MTTARGSDGTPLVDRLAASIQARVLSGEIARGSRLRQEALAAEFGVSRTPVREALRKLQATGVVELVPNRGAVVRGPSAREIREAYEVRAELEGLAAELATGRISDRDLLRLREAEALPDDPQAHHLLGSILLKLADAQAAVAALRRAVDHDPSLTEARVLLAQALAKAGQKDAARNEQIAIQRTNAERAAIGRAMVLLQMADDRRRDGDTPAAVAHLREAAALAPSLAEVHYQLGAALRHSPEQAVEGETALRKTLDLEPTYSAAYLELGLLYLHRGQTTAARDALERATRLAPGLAAAHLAFARALDALGARDDAARARALARQLDPSIGEKP